MFDLNAHLIDSCAVEFLWDKSIHKRFWHKFPAGTRHRVCPIIYWEFMRQFDAGQFSPVHLRMFDRWLESGDGMMLPAFTAQEAKIAVKLYQGVAEKLSGNSQSTRDKAKLRLRELHCDMIIASVALKHDLTVFTKDVEDWKLLASVVKEKKLGYWGKLNFVNPHSLKA